MECIARLLPAVAVNADEPGGVKRNFIAFAQPDGGGGCYRSRNPFDPGWGARMIALDIGYAAHDRRKAAALGQERATPQSVSGKLRRNISPGARKSGCRFFVERREKQGI